MTAPIHADLVGSCSVVTCSGLRSSATPAVLAQLQLAGKRRVSIALGKLSFMGDSFPLKAG
jgi:hypothetical protein